MKPIKVQKNYIDIPFVDDKTGETILELKFELSDEKAMELIKIREELADKEVKDYEGLKDGIKTMVDGLLGEGSFDKMFEITPVVKIVFQYFLAICEGITEELEERKLKQVNDELSEFI